MDKVKTKEVWVYQRGYDIKAHNSLNSKELKHRQTAGIAEGLGFG